MTDDQGLQVRDLEIDYGGVEQLRAIDGVSFDVAPGETVGLVGESGCGKSTVARSLIQLLPRNGSIVGGSVRWNGRELTGLKDRELAGVRWREISIVPQSSMNCLNPVYTVGYQIVEVMRAHGRRGDGHRRADEAERLEELCRVVGMDPGRMRSYPHELSGGMRQRSVLAMALALQPGLVIADEPTTGLDVIVQDRILRRIAQLQQERGFAMILVSHDIGVIAETCRTVIVMYAGTIVELGSAATVLSRPTHPYTMGLRNAFPEIRSRDRLVSIPGHPPTLSEMPTGCRFAPRCPFATDLCVAEAPPLRRTQEGQLSACHYSGEAPALRARVAAGGVWEEAGTMEAAG